MAFNLPYLWFNLLAKCQNFVDNDICEYSIKSLNC